MKTGTTRYSGLFGLLLLVASATAQAESAQPSAYVMVVYSDVAHGEKVLSGAPEEVIAKLSRKKTRRLGILAVQVNLCVAYTKTKQLEQAHKACDAAITASQKEARRLERSEIFGRRTTLVAETGRAIALTNRGVLHAISGESEQARTLFELAMSLESENQSASTNLDLLERKVAGRDS